MLSGAAPDLKPLFKVYTFCPSCLPCASYYRNGSF